MTHDLVIRGGSIVDGSGSDAFTGDLAIDGDRISQVGGRAGAGVREIDADGLVVAPGFIDPHTHYDAQIWWDDALTPSCFHGVTTVVMGNCGFTLAPCRPEGRGRIAKMLERVEGMSLAALEQGIDWQWESFPEFLDAIDARRPALNAGTLIGHSALRYYVLDAAATEREASEDEITQMCDLTREAMRAGALGFSTSQAPTHFGGDGKPVPSRFASDEEVLRLASVMHEFDHGAMEIVVKNLSDVTVSIEAARRSGKPVTFLGAVTREGHVEIAKARAEGLSLVPQTTCRPTLMDFTLTGGVMFDQLACWGEVMQARREALPGIFRDRAFRERFRDDISGESGHYTIMRPAWDDIRVIMTGSERMRGHIGQSVAEIAAARGCDPLDAFFDLPLEDDDLATEFSIMLSRDTDKIPSVLDDDFLLGLSDAGAHLTLLSDAAYTTYLLGRWVRERGDLSVERAVRMMTREPAEFWGIRERGSLAEGWFGDVVLFDPTTVDARDARIVFDLPGGDGRLLPEAVGVEAVIVNGQVSVEAGELTEARAGIAVRGGSSA